MTHPAFGTHAAGHLPEHGWQAQLFILLATGAQVLSVRNADPNNTFAISFETYPQDATGVAHILEHMVFRGSRNYPLSRPFSALLQSSLHSYLNASTQPDVTIFHLASLNQADFANLIDVKIDAVLRPMLSPAAFGDEACHIALDSIDAVPRLGGIVLAEMSGHLAVPLNALHDGLRRALYPGSVFAHVHGGDRAKIPDLTHAALVAFHRRHYHPSNARIFLWGDGVLIPGWSRSTATSTAFSGVFRLRLWSTFPALRRQRG